jgi:hypothetical protein
MAGLIKVGSKYVSMDSIIFAEETKAGSLSVHLNGSTRTIIVDTESVDDFVAAMGGVHAQLRGG